MKDYFNLRKSKLLLLMLLAMVAGGVSPAWAEEITEGFEYATDGTTVISVNSDNMGLSNGWVVIGSGSYVGIATGTSKDLQLKSGSYVYEGTYSIGTQYSNSNTWLVCPVEVSGTLKFYARRYNTSRTLTIGLASKNGETYTITNSSFASYTTQLGTEFTEFSVELGDDPVYVAFKPNYAYFDNVTYTPYQVSEGPALVVKDGSTKLTSEHSYNFGLATAGTTKTFTLSNPGTVDLGISVSETGNFGATLSATTIAAGGEATLTVTMPEATGNSAVTITPAAGSGIDPFVINVSGTIRDANKLYEYGFTALPTDWTTTGTWYYSEANGAYTTSWYLSSNARLITPKLTVAEGETFFVEAKGYSTSDISYQHLQMQYSADGSTWTNFDSEPTLDPSNWKTFAFTGVPAGNYYIAINASQADIRMFYGGQLPLEPRMVVTQPASLDFGVITEATAKTFTIANTGKATLEGISVTSSNSSIFAITGAPTSLAAGASAEVTITMSAATTGALSSDITVSATAMEDVKFTVTGVVLPEGMMVVDFNDNQLPTGWGNNASNKWSFSDGKASCTSVAELTTSALKFAEGDMLAIKATSYDNYDNNYIEITGSVDGTSWDAFTTKKFISRSQIPYGSYATLVVTDIPTTVKYLKFKGYYVVVDEISGLTYAPTLTVTKDEDVVTTPAAYDFGECSANASVTYNFANTGAGTINITNVAITGDGAAAYSTNWTESVAAPFDLTITRTYDADRTEAQAAVITVTTTDGDFVINVTGTDQAANAPALAVTFSEEAVADGAVADFGTRLMTAPAAKTYTITNSGTGTLTGTITTSDEGQFTVSKTSFSLGASESTTFDVALVFNETYGAKAANITIHPTNDGLEDIVIAASAYTYDPETWTEDFEAGTLPKGWEATTWTVGTFTSYENKTKIALAPSGSAAGTLITPCLTAKKDEVLSWDAYFNWYDEAMTVEYSTDKTEWTKIYNAYKAQDEFGNTRNTHKVMSFTAPADGDYYLRFTSTYQNGVDNFIGFKPCAQAPAIAVYSDAEATMPVASGTAKDLGWSTTAQSATYYIANSGTGTLTISEISNAEGFTVATAADAMTVVAGDDPLALTITMTNATVGVKSGTITLTTDGGNFEIPVSGFIYGDKNMVDFTDAAQYTGWDMEDWSVSAGVASPTSSYSAATMQTTPFEVAAGEKLYVDIKGTTSSGTKSFAYSYSTDNGENWTNGELSISASTYENVTDQVLTISDIADAEANRTVLIRFTSQNLGIKHIYGFTALKVPVMALDKTASSYNFGMQTVNADYVITVTNNGTATMNNLAATLETGKNYSVVITKPEGESTTTIDDGKATVPVGQSAVITVTQVYDAANGLASLSDVLTISADDVLSKTVSVSGQTRDASKWYVDFASGIPSTFIEKGSWSYSSQQGYVYDESALVSQTLTIAANEKIQFDVKTMSYSTPSLKVRHSINGGLSWSDYTDLTNEEGVNSSTYTTLQYSCGNTDASAVAMIEFLGANVYLDNIYGGTLNNETPMIQVKKGSTIVKNGEATEEFGTILEAKSAEYTIYNIGSGTMTITEAIETTGGATATISATSLGAGESATLTITMPVEAPYGEKAGAVTVETSLGDFVINYTATTMDPDALNITFNDYTLPTGWYVNGWSNSYDQYLSRTERNSDASFISQKLKVAGKDDILKFDAQKYGSYYASSTVLKVSYSTDRVNWTEIGDYASEMTTSWKTFSISGLEAGEYYLKFTGRYANVDNIIGWKKVSGIEHDLFVTATNIPANATINEELSITATVTSLIAAEKGVYAKLFIDDKEVATATPATADIALRGSQTFTMAYTAPSTAGTHKAQVKIYFSNGDEAFATAETDLEVSWPALTLNESETNTIEEGTFNVTLKRQFAEGWNTVCLPFAINDIEGVFGEGAKAYAFVNYDNGVIGFQKTTEIDAATPYVLYVPSAITEDMLFSNATISSTTSGRVEKSGAIFRGTYAPVAAGEWTKNADSDVIYGVTGQGKIAKAGASASIDGFRAYFDLPANAPASRLSFIDEDGSTTIINGIVMDKTTDENVYNLNGQRVETLKKGNLYIINGKKVIRK